MPGVPPSAALSIASAQVNPTVGDLQGNAAWSSRVRDNVASLDFQRVVPGLRNYIRKNGVRGIALGLSGGVDSALTAGHTGRTYASPRNPNRARSCAMVIEAARSTATPSGT